MQLNQKNDKVKAFYSFILSRLNNTHKAEIEKFFGDQELNSSYLASAVRHIFAHGKLSPHANHSQPKNTSKICDAISEFLLNIVDLEFAKRINQIDAELTSPSISAAVGLNEHTREKVGL